MKQGLETVLSAAYSLKHATDRAKHMGLTPKQATRQITLTPKGQFALYDEKKGEIVKSDRWRPPDFRSLIKIAQTEQGRSEVSCVLEEYKSVVMVRPMIFSEETGPTHFRLVCKPMTIHQTGLYPMHHSKPFYGLPIWRSSGCTPTMSSTTQLPRQPPPDGPTIMTWHQLEDVHKAIVTAHEAKDMSGMLKGVVSNMHLLAKFSREAGFLPYIGHAHYINSSRPPLGCDLSTVWSLQTDLDKGYAKGMFLDHETILVTTRSEWHYLSCHSSTLSGCQQGAYALLWT